MFFYSNIIESRGEITKPQRVELFIFYSFNQRISLFLLHGIKYLGWACLTLITLWVACTLYLFCKPSPYKTESLLITKEPITQKMDLLSITKGAISLQHGIKQDPFIWLRQEISLLAKNPWPANPGKNGDFLIYLKSSKSKRSVKRGEQVFLSCDALPGGLAPSYHFCEEKTPLWIKIDFSSGGTATLHAALFTLAKESSLFEEEKTSWTLEHDLTLQKTEEAPLFIDALKKGKVWGQDVTISRLFGEKYSHLQDKTKIEIPHQGKRSFCFVTKGDFLFYDLQGWAPVLTEKQAENKPIAYVKKASSKFVELEVWDPNTLYCSLVQLSFQSSIWTGIKSDLLPHSFLTKNGKQISCFFGKRKYFLKEGDWLIRGKRGWRHLRQNNDKINYLQHKILGELFIFESLTKESGKWMIKGILVDEMRTQTQPFSSLVAVENTSSKPLAQKKQNPSSKSDTVTTTYLSPTTSFYEEEQDEE